MPRAAGDLAKVDNGTLLLNGDYGRNWRRTALALDRIGLTVLGQNAERHAFLVQQAPAESEAVTNKNPACSNAGSAKTKKQNAQTAARPGMIVYVEPVNGGARISLLNKDGSSYKRQRRPHPTSAACTTNCADSHPWQTAFVISKAVFI